MGGSVNGGESPAVRLSDREREVLELAAMGLTNSEVGTRLNISTHAVKFHLAAIYRKLGVSNRTEAAFVHLRAHTTEAGNS
jgi:DNA-binding CsgD family transcriptional regulator